MRSPARFAAKGTVVASSDLSLQLAPRAPQRAHQAALAAAPADARQDDYGLVQRLIGGDALAWREFVDRFGRLVLARVLATAQEMNQPLANIDAEDLCADVFAELVSGNYAALARFEGRSALSTWLCVVTRRIVGRKLTRRRLEVSRAMAPQISNGVELLSASPADNPLAIIISNEDRQQVAAAMAELGERQREMARLYYVDGCTYREISQKLEMPINSVGPTLNRIHAKLRAALGQENGAQL
jgi:RNA polymerase sigma-70 factor (ECF subfamily)